MSLTGLFGDLVDPHPTTPEQRRARRKVDRAHAAPPGTGPLGETCRSCRHYERILSNVKVYRKCGLMKATRTRGPGTDIRAHDAACRKWEAPK